MRRICIYPSDISDITGRTIRTAQDIFRNLKIILNKKRHQFVTKTELADYLGIDPNEIILR